MRTEKSRLRRSLMSLRELMRYIRHDAIKTQVGDINAVLRGHYAYYGEAIFSAVASQTREVTVV